MKGLIRNNFYSVGSTLKWTIAFCMVINIGVIIGAVRFPSNDVFLPILISGQIGAFVGLTGTALQKDNASKWSKYERTLPLKICTVVRARYISFFIFAIIGILLGTITVLLFSLISGQPLNLERVGYGYSFGITFALVVPALLYPLVLKFGADKSEILLMIAVLITVGLFVGGSVILEPYLNHLNNVNMIYRIVCIAIGFIMFIGSYFISLALYKRKEF